MTCIYKSREHKFTGALLIKSLYIYFSNIKQKQGILIDEWCYSRSYEIINSSRIFVKEFTGTVVWEDVYACIMIKMCSNMISWGLNIWVIMLQICWFKRCNVN